MYSNCHPNGSKSYPTGISPTTSTSYLLLLNPRPYERPVPMMTTTTGIGTGMLHFLAIRGYKT